jgi:choline-sulfatase
MQATGEDRPDMYDGQPGRSLFALAGGEAKERSVLCEYHGMGSTAGAFALRHGKWKYVHYVAYPPQLFDLERDPEELVDLAGDARYEDVVVQCRTRLRAICDPAEVDARAKRRQAELLERNGGRDAVIARGDLGFTPAPGVALEFD